MLNVIFKCEVDENDDGGNDQNYVSKFLTTQTALQHRMADILEEIKNKVTKFLLRINLLRILLYISIFIC